MNGAGNKTVTNTGKESMRQFQGVPEGKQRSHLYPLPRGFTDYRTDYIPFLIYVAKRHHLGDLDKLRYFEFRMIYGAWYKRIMTNIT